MEEAATGPRHPGRSIRDTLKHRSPLFTPNHRDFQFVRHRQYRMLIQRDCIRVGSSGLKDLSNQIDNRRGAAWCYQVFKYNLE